MNNKLALQSNTVAVSDDNNTINDTPVGPAEKENIMIEKQSGRTYTVCTASKINNNNYTTHQWSWDEVLSRLAHSLKTNETGGRE